jgi:hypothetical protein
MICYLKKNNPPNIPAPRNSTAWNTKNAHERKFNMPVGSLKKAESENSIVMKPNIVDTESNIINILRLGTALSSLTIIIHSLVKRSWTKYKQVNPMSAVDATKMYCVKPSGIPNIDTIISNKNLN